MRLSQRHRRAPLGIAAVGAMILGLGATTAQAAVPDGGLVAAYQFDVASGSAVPNDVAGSTFGDAIVRLVVRHGVDVANVVTNSREIRTAVRAASLARDRGTCVIPGCGRTRNLQLHHVGSPTAFADTHITRLEQLAWLDPDHHDDITHRDATLTGTHPDWHYTPPDPRKTRERDRRKARRRAKRTRDHPNRT